VGQDDAGGRPPLIERIRERQERHRQRNRVFRVGFAAAGFVVLLLGIVMLFTPGPGWAVIVIGLGMLALEFAWAERLLERVIDRVERVTDQVTKGSRVRQAALIAAGLLVLAALGVALVLWDIPFFPG
jgi:uncharacterized protein (TIGR02611 family)